MFKNSLKIAYETPWKLINEVLMYLVKPFVLAYLRINGVVIGKNSKFYGFPKVFKTRGSQIKIGANFEARSWWWSNPLGISHPVILCTWTKSARIKIGDDVGISGGAIVAAKNITIGDRVLIGANSTIIDTDFHPTQGIKRYAKVNIKNSPVKIGDDVFIGMSAIILKGVSIADNAVVPAGETCRG